MPKKKAANALVDYMNAQLDEIAAGDDGLRRGEDPIHDTRVAIRRLRSTLRVFAKALDASATAEMDDELKWFAGLLGEVRDCQVQLRRFGEAVDDLPDTLVLGPVTSRIRDELTAIELPARGRVSEAMESERYQALTAVLRRWRASPPVGKGLNGKVLAKRAGRARHKADRRLAQALEGGSGDLLHRARKAAKRARYAAELRKPLDKRAKRTIKHFKHIQTVLGDHQDAVVATEALRRMAVAAGTTPGENGFTYGLLYAREQQIAAQSRKAVSQL
jgi:CHAD domain-containing protein